MPVLRSLFLDLPERADLYENKGYTDYEWEELLVAISNIKLTVARLFNALDAHRRR
jgi:hypothetical protein